MEAYVMAIVVPAGWILFCLSHPLNIPYLYRFASRMAIFSDILSERSSFSQAQVTLTSINVVPGWGNVDMAIQQCIVR